MSIKEVLELVSESTHTVMFLLARDVSTDMANIGFRDRERTVASSPREFSRQNIVRVDPVGRTSLQKLHQFLNRKASWKIDKRMDVIGVHVVDLHMEALVFGTSVK